MTHSETVPVNAIPLFAISNPNYQSVLNNTIESANKVYQEFLSSKEGKYFCGQVNKINFLFNYLCLYYKVVVVGDANGAILAYDALCLNHNLDDTTSLYGEGNLLYLEKFFFSCLYYSLFN